MIYQPIEKFEFAHQKIEGSRLSVHPDGTPTVSASTFLDILKPQEEKDALLRWRQRVGEAEADRISKAAADRGTDLHEFIESKLTGIPFEGTPIPSTKLMFNELWPNISQNLSVVHGVEMPLYSKVLNVHGITDCVGIWKGKLSIIDWKTSTKFKRREWVDGYFHQAALYAFMYKELYGEFPESLVIGIFSPFEGSVIYEDSSKQVFKTLKSKIEQFKRILDECERTGSIEAFRKV